MMKHEKQRVHPLLPTTTMSPPYVYPESLAPTLESSVVLPWTCVVVRPRWEKKFSRWLVSRDMAHFLPLIKRKTASGGKVRHTEVPLFPGYVFVEGTHIKRTFVPSNCVVRLLQPHGETATVRLAKDLREIHRLLISPEQPLLAPRWVAGQRIRILTGPLMGVTGRYVKDDSHGRLVAWIEFLGVGASVVLAPDTLMESVSDD